MSNIIIDVSENNGVVNWGELKKLGIAGGIARIIKKDLTRDKQFNNNYAQFNTHKIPWGVYQYTYATTVEKVIADLKMVCDILDKLDLMYFTYGIWFDIENKLQKALSKAQNAKLINAAQEYVEGRGYTFGCYTGMSFYSEYIDGNSVNTNNWWIARYYLDKTPFNYMQLPNEKYKPTMPKNIVAWQYTSHCKTGDTMTTEKQLCDQNIMYHLPEAPKKKTEEKKVSKVIIGSARIDERGKASGGAAGDQTGKEVSTQEYYVHSKGWYVIRPKSAEVAKKLAYDMKAACDNKYIGYDQNQRNTLYDVVKKFDFDCAKVKTKCETDCSALVRVCCAYAGIDVANFNTSSEKSVLLATGKFEALSNVAKDDLHVGDILVTKTKGHTAIVISTTAKQTESTSTPESNGKLSKTVKWTGKVYDCGALNVRTWAGLENPNIKTYPTIKAGTKVEVCDTVKDSKGNPWYYVRIAGKKYGFVSAKYIEKV